MAFLHLKWATLCIIVRRSLCTYAPLIHFRTAPLPPTPPSRYFEPREDRKITFRSSEILLLDDFSSFFVYFFPSCFFFFFQRFRIPRYYHFSTTSIRDVDVDRAESWMTWRFKDWMRNVWRNLFYPCTAWIVVCFGEILFVVSLENSLQFHPCIFFPLVGFVFEEDFLFSLFLVLVSVFVFFFFICALRRIMNYNRWRVKYRAKENISNNK